MKEKKMLSVAEVAELMGISRTHVLRKINSGEISATKVGRSFVINRSDLPGIYKRLTEREKEKVEKAVEKTFKEYADVIKKLGKT
jgi:excisionase family DNA binding protein